MLHNSLSALYFLFSVMAGKAVLTARAFSRRSQRSLHCRQAHAPVYVFRP